MIKIGVLALQGDFREHAWVLSRLGVKPVQVKYPYQLEEIQGIIIPGGESTTFSTLIKFADLLDPLKESIGKGLPAFGTCAGLILLAKEVIGKKEDQVTLGVLDVTVKRNAYGRQVDSFETDIAIKGADKPYRAIFIRAPKIERVGPEVEVLAEVEGSPVLVRERNVLGATFHPELNLMYPELGRPYVPPEKGDRLSPYFIHEYFLREMVGVKVS